LINGLLVKKDRKDYYLYAFIYTIITFIICIAVFMTGSRAGMLAMFLGGIIVFTYYMKGRNIVFGVLLLSAGGLIILCFLPDRLIQRMLYFNTYLDGSNYLRLMNWYYGIKAFFRSPLIGYGMVYSNNVLFKYFSYVRAAHNTYITFLIQFGLIGALPVILILAKIFFKTLKGDMRVIFGALISMLFTSMMIENNISITFWMVLTLTYMVYNYKRDNPGVNVNEII